MSDKAQIAVNFIISHCPTVGAFYGTGEPYSFLHETADEMRKSKPTTAFPDRYIEHVAHAIEMVATNSFLTPPAAVASVYLATRFEFYFRMLSGKLNADGTWISISEQNSAQSVIKDQRLNRPRINSVALAYDIMLLGSSKVISYCSILDKSLYPSPTMAVGGFSIANVGNRIEFGRHSVGHGHWGDISSESVFYGLMTAVIFYAH